MHLARRMLYVVITFAGHVLSHKKRIMVLVDGLLSDIKGYHWSFFCTHRKTGQLKTLSAQLKGQVRHVSND